MKIKKLAFLSVCLQSLLLSVNAEATNVICTIILDVSTNHVVFEEGDCKTQVTPASTFKIPLAIMGFDAGFLIDSNTPKLKIKKGEPDWGGKAWLEPVNPTKWMKYSVVWFSQRITHALGAEKIQKYLVDFQYGNTDFSGDGGKNNALERAWISSSLKISPLEQVIFLQKFINRQLPIKQKVFDQTANIIQQFDTKEGWCISGKTGMAYPRQADGSFDRKHAYGWFVGWAIKANETLVVATLHQDQEIQKTPTSHRARDAFLKDFPTLINLNKRQAYQ